MPIDTSSSEALKAQHIDLEAARQGVRDSSLHLSPETETPLEPTEFAAHARGGVIIEAAHRFAQSEHRQAAYAAQLRDPLEVEAYNRATTSNLEAMRQRRLHPRARQPAQGFSQIWGRDPFARQRELIAEELRIGSAALVPPEIGRRRSFFNLDPRTWVWHEAWEGPEGRLCTTMVTYEFQPRGVLRTVDGMPRGYAEGKELDHLLIAIRLYHDLVTEKVYGHPVSAALAA